MRISNRPLHSPAAQAHEVGSRPAGRTYPAINVATGYTYDNLGRVTAIDAGVERVKFTYTYHPNTNNIATKTFHHRNPVMANSYQLVEKPPVWRINRL